MVSILVGAVALFVFGALWYTVLFGKMWAGLMGFGGANMAGEEKGMMAKSLVLNFLLQVITAWVVYFLFPQLLATSYSEFLKVLLVVWLGFSFPIYANQALWERKSWKLVVLNSANGILSVVIISAIIYFI